MGEFCVSQFLDLSLKGSIFWALENTSAKMGADIILIAIIIVVVIIVYF